VMYHIDTGTTRTVVSEKIWLKSGGNVSQLRSSKLKITSVTTHPIEVLGEVDVELTVGTQRMVMPVQIARNVSDNCFLGLDAISKVEGGNEMLKGLVNLFKTSNAKTLERGTHIEEAKEDQVFEQIKQAKENWVVKRRNSSSDEDEPVKAKERCSNLTEIGNKSPETINGFVGDVEVVMNIDVSQSNSFLSEEVWMKSGNVPAHLKPVKSFNYTYNGEKLSVIGERSFGHC